MAHSRLLLVVCDAFFVACCLSVCVVGLLVVGW